MRYKRPSERCHRCCTQGAVQNMHQTGPRTELLGKVQCAPNASIHPPLGHPRKKRSMSSMASWCREGKTWL
jgi:hypothetical protein